MKWTELWDGVVRMLWHCKHERIEQGCVPMSRPMTCLQVCVDCGSVQWLPDPAGKGWRRPALLQALVRAMPMFHEQMEPALEGPGTEQASESPR